MQELIITSGMLLRPLEDLLWTINSLSLMSLIRVSCLHTMVDLTRTS